MRLHLNGRVPSIIAAAIIICALGASAVADQSQDPIASNLFPPDLVMGHAADIGLNQSQMLAIRSEAMIAGPQFQSLEPQLEKERKQLGSILQSSHIDEASALRQVDAVLATEHKLKHAQLIFMIRIKNLLTSEQQGKLRALGHS